MQLKYSIFSLQKRLLALIMLVTFVFLVLAGRLIFLQVIKAEELQTLASSQWTRALPIVAKRGDILDTKGSVLATSYTTYDVYVRSRNVVDKGEVASHLSSVLNISYDTVYNKISNSITSEVLIKMQVDENTIKKIGGKEAVRLHLEKLGFVPGASVTVVSEFSGNVIVKIKDSRIAVSREMAEKILV